MAALWADALVILNIIWNHLTRYLRFACAFQVAQLGNQLGSALSDVQHLSPSYRRFTKRAFFVAVELGWSAQGGVVHALTNSLIREGADSTRGAAFFKNYQPIVVKIFSLRYKKVLGPLIGAINGVYLSRHKALHSHPCRDLYLVILVVPS